MRYIFALILTVAVCASGYAAQLKDTYVNGSLGVGTSTPSTKLHVAGTVTATAATIGGVVSVSAQDGAAFIDTNANPSINVGIGTVTTSGIETIVKYNSTGTFTVPMGVTSLKVLVVGGGAGGDGGVASAVYGHGGGGGRVTYRSAVSVTEGSSHTVTVGTGGAAGAMDAQASPGGQSAFGSVTAAGGVQANNIGSGGDGGDSGNDINSVVTNYNGLTDSVWGAAGGAGAGGVGGTVSDTGPNTGGIGYSSSITGTSTAYGAGGNGSYAGSAAPSTVAANLGLGGHGHGTSMKAGGSGVVIIRFMTSYDTLTVNNKLRIDARRRLSVGGTQANNSLTVINDGVNGVGIDLRSDDTDLSSINNFSVARLFADFTSGSYADSRLYLQTATGDNAWKTGLTIKDGKVGIETGTPTTTLHVIGTVTATGFVGNGSQITGISAIDGNPILTTSNSQIVVNKSINYNQNTITGTLADFNAAVTDADLARTDAANTFTGVQTFSTPIASASMAAMTATVGGRVPTPPNNTTTYLRGDGTFAAPAGGGGSGDNLVLTGLSGGTTTTGKALYFSTNDTLATATWTGTETAAIGFSNGSVGQIIIGGKVSGLTGLTANRWYVLAGNGDISLTGTTTTNYIAQTVLYSTGTSTGIINITPSAINSL